MNDNNNDSKVIIHSIKEFKEMVPIAKIAELVFENQQPSSMRNKHTTKYNVVYSTFYKQEKTPSFKISERNNCFRCFSTGNYGDGIRMYRDYIWIKESRLLNELDVCKEIAEKLGYVFQSFSSMTGIRSKTNSDIEKIFSIFGGIVQYANYEFINSEDKRFREYIKNRGFDPSEVAYSFEVGIADPAKLKQFLKNQNYDVDYFSNCISNSFDSLFDDCILFPVKNEDGKVVSFFSRNVGNTGDKRYIQLGFNELLKDITPFNRYNYLFGLDLALSAAQAIGKLVLVEGCFDVLRLRQKGIQNVAGLMSSEISLRQIQLLQKLGINEVYLLLDGDSTGQAKDKKIAETLSYFRDSKTNDFTFSKIGIITSDEYMKSQKDPDEYFKDMDPKDVGDFLKENELDYRKEKCEQYITKYKEDEDFPFDELVNEIGTFLQYSYPTIRENLYQYILDKRKGDVEVYEEYFFSDKVANSIFLMNKLNFTKSYSLDLLNQMAKFQKRIKTYHYFMNGLLKRLKEEYDQNFYRISSFLNLHNRKSVGEHLTNFNITVKYNANIVNQIKLNYLDDFFIAYNRFPLLKKEIEKGVSVRNDEEYNDVMRIDNLYMKLTEEFDKEERDPIQNIIEKVVSFLGDGMDDESKKQ